MILQLSYVFDDYVESELCCFIPGKVIDEIFSVQRKMKEDKNLPRFNKILQELRDISTMAKEHFQDKIVPTLGLISDPVQNVADSIMKNVENYKKQVEGFKKEVEQLKKEKKKEKETVANQNKKISEMKKKIDELLKKEKKKEKDFKEKVVKTVAGKGKGKRDREGESQAKIKSKKTKLNK